MAKSGRIIKSERQVCYSSWVVTGLPIAVDQDCQPPAKCSCQLLHSYLNFQQKEDKTCLLAKVILAFKQCQNLPVACMPVLSLCSGLWYRRNEEGPILSLWMLAATQPLSTTGIPRGAFRAQRSTVKSPNGKGVMSVLGQRTGFSEYLTQLKYGGTGKETPSGSLISLSGSFLQSCVKDFRAQEWKEYESWKQEKQGHMVMYFGKSHLPHNTRGEGGVEGKFP